MKKFLKVFTFLALAAAALVGLSLLEEKNQKDRYISVYDSDDDMPF